MGYNFGYNLGDGDQLTSATADGLGAAIDAEGGSDPMAGLVNLVDVMLVFACGLMLALVTYWNLDLPTVTELKDEQMNELSDADEMAQEARGGNAYIERGIVYQDPVTGKLYWMEDTAETEGGTGVGPSGGSSATGGSDAAGGGGATGAGGDGGAEGGAAGE